MSWFWIVVVLGLCVWSVLRSIGEAAFRNEVGGELEALRSELEELRESVEPEPEVESW